MSDWAAARPGKWSPTPTPRQWATHLRTWIGSFQKSFSGNTPCIYSHCTSNSILSSVLLDWEICLFTKCIRPIGYFPLYFLPGIDGWKYGWMGTWMEKGKDRRMDGWINTSRFSYYHYYYYLIIYKLTLSFINSLLQSLISHTVSMTSWSSSCS